MHSDNKTLKSREILKFTLFSEHASYYSYAGMYTTRDLFGKQVMSIEQSKFSKFVNVEIKKNCINIA